MVVPLHPQAAEFLAAERRAGARPDHRSTVRQARARADQNPGPDSVEHVATVIDTEVPCSDGRTLPIRIYTPDQPPLGVVVYAHGGGHVTGTVGSYDGLNRRFANRVPATVVAVEYRRAPEYRCPAPIDDVHAAYTWVLSHLAELIPPHLAHAGSGVVALAGDSAGGNITAVLAHRLRNARAPLPALQVLIYPPVDAVAYRDLDAFPSYRECGNGFGLTYPDGLWYWDHYLGPDGDPNSPEASPMRARSLAGLPPAYVLTVEYDVLRDEGTAYADRLAAAGVPVHHRRWDGHLHGFLGDPHTFDDADRALDDIADGVRTAFSSNPARAYP